MCIHHICTHIHTHVTMYADVWTYTTHKEGWTGHLYVSCIIYYVIDLRLYRTLTGTGALSKKAIPTYTSITLDIDVYISRWEGMILSHDSGNTAARMTVGYNHSFFRAGTL